MALNKQRRFFEFGDQPWMKGWAREAYLDCLNAGLKFGGHYNDMDKPFRLWAAGCDEVVDLASGGGGPAETMLLASQSGGKDLPRIILSDLFPSCEHYEQMVKRYGSSRLGYLSSPISADEVPAELPRLRSICSAFHHFSPDKARGIIEDAAKNSDGIFIAEPLQRDLRHFFMVLLSGPFPYMLGPFLGHHFSLCKLLLCTIIPVFPLLVWFDGCVSALRTYKSEEIEAMFPEAAKGSFEIEHGTCPYLHIFASTFFYARRRK